MGTVPRGRARRALWGGTIAVVLIAIAALLFSSIARQRVTAADAIARRAGAAVDRARGVDALVWAADELLAAEHARRQAEVERRLQEGRWWWIPDYTEAEAAWLEAEAAATDAEALTIDRREAARRGADERLALASAAVEQSAGLAATIHVGADRLALLSRARLALDEARVFRREGDYGSATTSADRATDLAGRVLDHAAAVAARYADARVVDTWLRLKEDTIAWSRRERRAAIVVSKEGHRVTLYVNGDPFKVYRADMGFNWVADKRLAGDGATPEGRYTIVERRSGGATLYYKALLLDYPNADDRRAFTRARQNGNLPPGVGIGGLIEIHGEGGRGRDWTKGCVALTNADIDDLFDRVGVGTPVTIVGSDEPGPLAALAAERDAPGAGVRR